MRVRFVVVFAAFALLVAALAGGAAGSEDGADAPAGANEVSEDGPREPPVQRPPVYVNPNEPEQFLGATLAGSLLATRPVDWAVPDREFLDGVLASLEAGDVRAAQDAGVLLAPNAELTRMNLEAVLAQLPDEVAVPTRTEDGRLLTRSAVDVTASATYLMEEYSISWRDAVLRLERQASYNALADWISTELKGTTEFGGAWIDQDDGGRLVINGTTESFLADRDADLGGNNLIRTDEARYSLLELEDAANDAGAELERAGLVADPIEGLRLGVDIKRNAVVLTIPSGVPQAWLQEADLWADDRVMVETVATGSGSLESAGCPRDDCSDSIGSMRTFTVGLGCSANFSFTQGVNSTFYLTAGHCSTATGQTVGHPKSGPSRIVGNVAWRVYENNAIVDAAVIDDVNRSLGWPVAKAHIIRSSGVDISDPLIPPIGDQEWAVWTTLARNEVLQGQVICRSGATTADTCGQILSPDTMVEIDPPGQPSFILNQQGTVDALACPGDSGGPVYDEVSHAAIGIAGASIVPDPCQPSSSNFMSYSYVSDALSLYSVNGGGVVSVDTVSPSMMRVTTNNGSGGGVSAQIVVDGEIRNTWGLNWFEISDGLHEVCFTDAINFTTPPCQTKLVAPGAVLTVQGFYQPRGFLRVTTAPPVASTIKVNGFARNDWGIWVDVPPGSYNVCFGNAPNLQNITPCQSVSVTAGNTAFVTSQPFLPIQGAGEPPPWGMLRVTTDINTSPGVGVPSQILVDGIIRDRWGLNWMKLPPDLYWISFTDVQGFTTPADKPVGIVNGVTSSRNAVFKERGWLRVYQPTNPVGGTIYVRDLSEPNKGFIARDAWGMWTDYPPGDYEVCWGPVAGRTAPPCTTATVVAGQTHVIPGTYQ